VDFRDFDSYESIYDFLSNMDESSHQKYIKNISKYMNSEQSADFKIDSLISTFKSILKL